MTWRRLLAVAALALGAGLTGCGASPGGPAFRAGSTMDELQRAGRITVGVKFDQPGVGFRDPATRKLEGFDIEIAEIVAAELGLEPSQIRYVETVSADRERFIRSGRVDIVIASYSITTERQQEVGQAGPYYVASQRYLVRKEDEHKVRDADFAGVKVCSVTSSTSIKPLQERKAELVSVRTYTECIQKLLNRSVDAVTTDDVILLGYAAQQPDKFAVVGASFSPQRYGIGYQKGDEAFCEFLSNTIKKAVAEGAWQRAFYDTLGKANVPLPEKPAPSPCPAGPNPRS